MLTLAIANSGSVITVEEDSHYATVRVEDIGLPMPGGVWPDEIRLIDEGCVIVVRSPVELPRPSGAAGRRYRGEEGIVLDVLVDEEAV